jgi:hypothetical protein
MTEGLITRIGKWIDNKWAAKATEVEVYNRWKQLENAAIQDKIELQDKMIEDRASVGQRFMEMDLKLEELRTLMLQRVEALSTTLVVTPKEHQELKERLGHLEVYVGMKRVVDPSKPAVAKSAFAM